MTWAHLHMLLNHVPTVGTGLAILLLAIAFIRRSDDLRRVGLEAFFVIALTTVPVYMSGLAAQEEIQKLPGISNQLIEAHEDAAALSFALMLVTGLVAWVSLWQQRRKPGTGFTTSKAVLVLSVVTLAITARAANVGGEIRHPEMVVSSVPQPDAVAVGAGPVWLSANMIGKMMGDLTWLWPASETLHFIGMWLLFGVVLIVNLRMLGIMKSVSFADVHRLLPWAALGFALSTVTGMLFVSAAPEQYALNL